MYIYFIYICPSQGFHPDIFRDSLYLLKSDSEIDEMFMKTQRAITKVLVQ